MEKDAKQADLGAVARSNAARFLAQKRWAGKNSEEKKLATSAARSKLAKMPKNKRSKLAARGGKQTAKNKKLKLLADQSD